MQEEFPFLYLEIYKKFSNFEKKITKLLNFN